MARILFTAVYNIWFHPLSKFPGPSICCTTTFIRQSLWAAGYLDHYLVQLHARYGPVVRYGPDALSFTTGTAWKDIYGYGDRVPRTQLPKVASRGRAANPGIMDASDSEHARLRKSLGRAFSAANVRASQDIVEKHVAELTKVLRRAAKTSERIDLTHALAETSFRMSEEWGFGMVGARAKLPNAPETAFQFLAAIPKSRLVESWPRLGGLLAPLLQPAHWHNTRPRIGKYTKKLVVKRLKEVSAGKEERRYDFVRALLPSSGPEGHQVDIHELAVTSAQAIVAGSETTSAALIGVMYWLLRSPAAFDRLRKELQPTTSANSLEWLHCCILEAMRMYPPSPSAFARRTSAGPVTDIDGQEVPGETIVGVHQYAAYQSAGNFARPHEYKPERWLGPATVPAEFKEDNHQMLQPFSYGPRDCAGKQMAWSVLNAVVAAVVRDFDIELDNEQAADWTRQRIFQVWEAKPLMCRIRHATREMQTK